MARRVIALKGVPFVNEDGVAAEAIKPGHLVSGVTSISLNDGDPCSRTFALERDELGDDIDEPYAVGDVVEVGSFYPGQRVYAWLASGQNVSEGEFLEPQTNGLLTAYSSGTRIARALEGVDASAPTDGIASRIRVEVY